VVVVVVMHKVFILLRLHRPFAVTVGSGGAAVSAPLGPGVGVSGNAGGTTSFAALISATGGAAGNLSPTSATSGGSGGTGSSGAINIPGQPADFAGISRAGGSAILGFGSIQVSPGSSSGVGYGAGGSASDSLQSPPFQGGGAGAGGVVIVEF
jgi:hypothetical protein